MTRQFVVFVGDIAECPARVIVNSCNTSLGLGSGVSASISDVCGGLQYQAEVRAALAAVVGEAGAELPHGGAILTGAGLASDRFDAIIHAAVVKYTGGISRDVEASGQVTTRNIVGACVKASLELLEEFLEQNQLQDGSLGIPLLGAGSGHLGKTQSAEEICLTLRRYFERYYRANGDQSRIRKVVLVGRDVHDGEIARQALLMHRLVAR